MSIGISITTQKPALLTKPQTIAFKKVATTLPLSSIQKATKRFTMGSSLQGWGKGVENITKGKYLHVLQLKLRKCINILDALGVSYRFLPQKQ